MLQFSFTRITFTKAAKYVFLLTTLQQTKRTDVCHSWTSSPTFNQPIVIQDSEIDQTFKVKACEATIDRKLKILGQSIVYRNTFTQTQTGLCFDQNLELIQTVEGKSIVVGRFHLIVKKSDQQQPKSQRQIAKSKVSANKQKPNHADIKSMNLSVANSLANSKVVSPFNSARMPQQTLDSPRNQPVQNKSVVSKPQQSEEEIDSDFEMKSDPEEEESQNDCSIRFFIHGGTNFYLGSSFSVQVNWSDRYCQTQYIKDKILPQWGQSLVLLGNSEQSITVSIVDEKKNILEWTKFSLKNIRKLYPYHLKLVFREEYMGDRPVIYLSFMREDLPKFTILDKQIRLIVGYQGDNVRNPLQYLAIQGKQEFEAPRFFELDLRKIGSFEQVNKFIESFEIGDYNWNFFMPLETGKREIIMFKSQLNKQLNLFLVSVRNWTNLFSDQSNTKRLQSVSVVEKRPEFQHILKQIYYHQEVHAVGKVTQIYSETSLAEDKIKDNNTWRTLTKNYILRNNLLNTSIKNLEILRNQITNKGEELIKLKKILSEVKAINTTLKQKQKSTLILSDAKYKKQKLSAQNFKITDIEMMLYEKQAELQFKKKRNQEMIQRMESLNTMEEDTTELDLHVTRNAKNLLQQQQKIKLMLMVRKQLPKQRIIIRKLQQIFEKLQIDRNMNELLKGEQEKLGKMREKKRQDLKRVYELVCEKNSKQSNLHTRIEQAEKQLIRLNEAYAKLTGL